MKLHDNRDHTIVGDSPARAGESVRTVRNLEEHGDGGSVDRITSTSAAFCASCQRSLFAPEAVGGVCITCHRVICKKCTARTCAICSAVCCNSSACSKILNGKKVCRTHDFLSRLKFTFVGHR